MHRIADACHLSELSFDYAYPEQSISYEVVGWLRKDRMVGLPPPPGRGGRWGMIWDMRKVKWNQGSQRTRLVEEGTGGQLCPPRAGGDEGGTLKGLARQRKARHSSVFLCILLHSFM